MFYQDIKKAINHYVETIKGPTKITGYRLNTILNDIYDSITNVSWISQTITNGVTDKSPSEDAVFDALALKADISSLPLTYKALLSQNAPISATNSDTMIAGQIWELSGAANPSDYGTIDTFELVSGTLYAAGSKYRVSVNTPFTFSASAMEYDGSPYVVSTDVNGDFNPFSNTLGGSPVFTWVSANRYLMTLAGVFPSEDKVGVKFGKGRYSTDGKLVSVDIEYFWNDANSIGIETYLYKPSDAITSGNATGGLLNYHLIEIEVYP